MNKIIYVVVQTYIVEGHSYAIRAFFTREGANAFILQRKTECNPKLFMFDIDPVILE